MSMRYVVVTKQDCPTCRLVEPVLAELAKAAEVRVFNQDAADFPMVPGARVVFDESLEES